jgi:serine/threonine protein kinase
MDDHRKPLAAGHFIAGYRIVREIGYGGFGIVYEAVNPYTKDRAAIKQFFPQAISSWRQDTIVVEKEDDRRVAERILKRFESEAAVQSSFDHPNILKVKNFIRENNTGYLITEFIDGKTLLEHLEQYGYVFPNEDMFRQMLEPISEAIGYVHKRLMLHRDISPDNILVDKSGRAVLVDFGAAKLDLRRNPSTSTIVPYKPDYAPIEQAEPSMERPEGYYTDIFALAGTMYRLLSGRPPERAIARALAVRDPYIPIAQITKTKCSDAVYNAIDRGLSVAPANRPESIESFMQLLGWRGPPAPPLIQEIKPEEFVGPPRKRSKLAGHAAVLVLVVGIVAGLLFFSSINGPLVPTPVLSPQPNTAAVTPTASPTARPPVAPPQAASPSAPTATPAASPTAKSKVAPQPTASSQPALAVTPGAPSSTPKLLPSPVVIQATPTPTASPDSRQREVALYQAAHGCIADALSCNVEGCLSLYRDSFGTGERFPALREEYLKVMNSPRCSPPRPPPAPPPIVDIPMPPIADIPTPDLRESEVSLYQEAHRCITEAGSCNVESCLNPYRDSVGTAGRFPALREEYLKVMNSPRCSPPRPPSAPPPIVVTAPPAATPIPPPAQVSPPAPAPAGVPPAYVPPPPPVSYTTYANVDMEGGDLAGPPQLYGGQLDCEALCSTTADQQCVGYAYDKWIKACYLKGSLTEFRSDPESTVVIRSNLSRPRFQSGALDIEAAGRRFNEVNTPYSRTNIASRKSCSDSCRTDKTCLGYQFENGFCSRYDQLDNATKDAKAQSGVKRQIGPDRGAKH